MRSDLAILARHDIRLQYRYGIYAAYAVVVATYVGILLAARAYLPDAAVAFIIFSDPAALGFFFLGALMMLERSEGVRPALATAPISPMAYLWAKMLTLTGVALVASVVLFAAHGSGNIALLLLAVALTSVQFVGWGVPIALRFKTVSGYLIGSAGFLTPVIAPSWLALFDPFPLWLAVVPSVSQFRLMLVATEAAAAGPVEVVVMLAIALVYALASLWLARWALTAEFGR
jgi:fluoroquinolone transport system permease protein